MMMKEVMGEIVADVSKDSTTENGSGGIPVVEENRVGELPERHGEHDEQSRRHH